uniref:SCY1-like protein 2 n=2 Tax=Culex pipiens TaxID=7175 RepID=A0A8D8FQB3_CULPI
MDVINKLYSTVSQTVSQISLVLPGNPVTREYDVLKHTASAGRGCVWKIYNGVKKSTREEASIFLLEKKQFELYAKDEKEVIFNIIRKGIFQITKLRHPLVLTVQTPLEESRESFAFATEPIFASMANIIGESIPSSVVSELMNYKLHDAELKFGILQLFEGLNFIHNEAKLIHRNISPHSILLNTNGAWKLFGFDYSVSSSENEFECDFYENRRNTNILSFPDLNFVAPECILNNKCTSRSDYYSIGMLICVIYLKTCNPYKSRNNDISDFKIRAANLSTSKHPILEKVPPIVQGVVEPLLSFNPEQRPDLRQVAKGAFGRFTMESKSPPGRKRRFFCWKRNNSNYTQKMKRK